MAMHRLRAEWKNISRDQPPLCYIEPSDKDFFHWRALMMGPLTSPFQGTAIFLNIRIPTNYPYKPPKIQFITPIYHPNVDDTGDICIDIFRENWSPALKINQLLICISSILSDPLLDGTPFNIEAAKMYEENRKYYNFLAAESCENDFTEKVFQHFYMKFYFWQFGNLRKKFIKFNYERDIMLEDLCYPNDKLEENFRIFERKTSTFIPLKVIKAWEKAKQVFQLIQEENLPLIITMAKSGDPEFIENNVEFELCNNLQNICLWKLYFIYLRMTNTKKLLQIYSLYCRFFPNDIEIFEEYKKTAEEFGPSLILWRNPFEFENFDENVVYARSGSAVKEPITCFFSPKNHFPQNLPFKSPLINYILQNAAFLQKVQMSCKYFFIRSPNPICYKLKIVNEPTQANAIEFNESSVKIINKIPENFNIQNIYLAEILTVERNSDPKILSNILTKFHKCDAKYISIIRQNLTETEIKFLLRSKNVIELALYEVKIVDADGNESTGIMLEEILKFSPKIQQLTLDCINCSLQTSKIISKLSFTNKIKYFCERTPTCTFSNLHLFMT